MNVEEKGIRGGTRIPVELPVQIRWTTREGVEQFVEGKTSSMSGNGLFISAAIQLRHDTPINFTVSLPAEITKIPMQLRCEGRVIRQQNPGAPPGIGVVIDDYHLAAAERSE
ncbi:MAG: PilZ domain-containing protein [Acidobacteriota bacterium]